MKNIRDIIRNRREQESKLQTKISTLRCVTVGVDYPNDCAVKDRPGYIWVREQKANSAIFQVFNTEVKRLVGLNLIISTGSGTNLRQAVSGIDWDVTPMTSDYPTQNAPTVFSHAMSHEWQELSPGADAISVYPRAIAPLRVYPAKLGDIKVDIAQGFYGVSGKIIYFEGIDSYDLSSYQPFGTSKYVGVLVYINVDTNVAASIAGEIFTTLDGIIYPDIPVNTLPLAYVNLASTALTLSESDIVLDLRPVFTVTDKSLQSAIGALENEMDIELTRHIVQGV